ncbi:MAG: DinB family protein [Acidobacteriia bacterium]|nr:DinB family protein [Terriglobia bacterium]
MLSHKLRFPAWGLVLLAAAALPASAQIDIKAKVLKHLQTSRDFTLKVADQMPETTYDFKLTPAQMSFAQQMVHLSQALEVFWSPFFGGTPAFAKPASTSKTDVIAFMKKSFDTAIERISKLTPEQLAKSYQSGEGNMTGLELLMGMMDHTTHHRASAEMYLRAKGITPAEYEF